ncbi:DUF4147 domain-containing protein [Pleionea sp. CnH1-48]|uniref:DUF4147 domain-containing protein n=1 Tax=Pleionea sp. CnH1-48 TaxID=2954494 RepID=UPI00209834D4|nr:DUF4147 domain-containing protein [Pleionea sp. CnH1-48]MCO7222963.1 DUF4147 domain-containing protein [Pleionea sp. CnH1-48]
MKSDLQEAIHLTWELMDAETRVNNWLTSHQIGGEESLASSTEQKIEQPLCVVSIGKAALPMFEGARKYLREIKDYLVITAEGYGVSDDPKVLLSSHPFPDHRALAAAQALVSFLQKNEGAELLFLISGGSSALVELPLAGIEMGTINELNQTLVSSGLDIEQINQLRSQLSQIKGGQLRRWIDSPKITQLSLSDVAGDNPAVIGSGLLFESSVTREPSGSLFTLMQDKVNQLSQQGLNRHGQPLTQTSERKTLPEVAHFCIGNSLLAAELLGQELVLKTELPLQTLTEINLSVEHTINWFDEQLSKGDKGIWIAHGETTLALPAEVRGSGGRNCHLALSMARQIAGDDNLVFASFGSDGQDGSAPAAGALVDGNDWLRLNDVGVNPNVLLSTFNSYTGLEAINACLKLKKGRTNVRDLMVAIRW